MGVAPDSALCGHQVKVMLREPVAIAIKLSSAAGARAAGARAAGARAAGAMEVEYHSDCY